MKSLRLLPFLFLLATMFVTSNGCQPKVQNEASEAAPQESSQAGNYISYELMRTLSLEDLENIRTVYLQAFLETASMPASEYQDKLEKPKYAVKLYKVKYNSVIPEKGNKPVITSGIIAIPEVTESALPLISYQHGTIFDRSWAPSAFDNSVETQLMVAQFAAQGYVLIAADYFGFGESSDLPNSYFVRQSTEQACMDLYKASLEILEKEGKKSSAFFVSGWSQGAYNTMAFLRALERASIPVNAAFTAAAPVDPIFFISRGFFNPREIDAVFSTGALCNVIFSIESYSGDTTMSKRYIKDKYYATARNLFDFKTSFEAFRDTVPNIYGEVFSEELFTDAKLVTGPLWPILSESQVYRWLSSTPLRSYGGGLDEAVPDYVSYLGIDYMKRLGKKDAEAFSAGPMADHRNTYLYSIIHAKPWIDSFK